MSSLNRLMKIIDKINFHEKEAKELDIRVENERLTWKITKGGKPKGEVIDVDKSFEFSDEEAAALTDMLKGMNEKKEFKPENAALGDVAKQLNIEL